jgi:hypothetical protein
MIISASANNEISYKDRHKRPHPYPSNPIEWESKGGSISRLLVTRLCEEPVDLVKHKHPPLPERKESGIDCFDNLFEIVFPSP